MAAPALADEVTRWIVRHELRHRLHRAPEPAVLDALPDDVVGTVLTDRVLPAYVRERRLRFLEAAGWLPPLPDVCDPDDLGLPAEAGLVDRVACVGRGREVVARDGATAAMAAALGVPVRGAAVPPCTADDVDRALDDVADRADPGWRLRAGTPSARYARLEALTTANDVLFGRSRRPAVGDATRRAVRTAGVVKRRLLG